MKRESQTRSKFASGRDVKAQVRQTFSPSEKRSRTRQTKSKRPDTPPKGKKRVLAPILAFPDPFLPGFAPHELIGFENAAVTNRRQSASILNSPNLRLLDRPGKKPKSADSEKGPFEDPG